MVIALFAAALTGIDLPPIGHLRTRESRQIEYSNWGVAGEGSPDEIARLGFKKARITLGPAASWPQAEHSIQQLRARSIRPWFWVDLTSGPADPSWLSDAGAHFRDLIHEWEIDPGRAGRPADRAKRYAQTAILLRRAVPHARLDVDLPVDTTTDLAEAFLGELQRSGQLDLVDAIALHSAPDNPDDTSQLAAVHTALARFPRPIEVSESAVGAPASLPPAAAGKWYTRRMLRDLSEDTSISLATPSPAAAGLTALFDDVYKRMPHFRGLSNLHERLASSAYERGRGGPELICLWLRSRAPASDSAFAAATLESPDVRFTEPVYLDLLTGAVYAIPADRWLKRRGGAVFKQLPVTDSPTLIAERSAIPLVSP